MLSGFGFNDISEFPCGKWIFSSISVNMVMIDEPLNYVIVNPQLSGIYNGVVHS